MERQLVGPSFESAGVVVLFIATATATVRWKVRLVE
jgi:hypothetical protein